MVCFWFHGFFFFGGGWLVGWMSLDGGHSKVVLLYVCIDVKPLTCQQFKKVEEKMPQTTYNTLSMIISKLLIDIFLLICNRT